MENNEESPDERILDRFWILPEELHGWYLEATKNLKKESFNPDAQKCYDELTKEQKFIDIWISELINDRLKIIVKLCKEEFEKELEKHYVNEKTALKDAKEFDRRIKEDKQKAFSEGFAKAIDLTIKLCQEEFEKDTVFNFIAELKRKLPEIKAKEISDKLINTVLENEIGDKK